jgi:hypothetical protein
MGVTSMRTNRSNNKEPNGASPVRLIGYGVAVILFALFAAILAVLASGFRGALYDDVNSPKKLCCASNLKELGLALQAYTKDYNDMLPSSVLRSGSGAWNKVDFSQFASIRGALMPEPGLKTYPMVLFNYIKNKEIMWCPSDDVSHDDPNARVSFYYKAAVDRAWYGGFKHRSDFAFPGDQIVFYERKGFHSHKDNLADEAKINVVYLDTHVRWATVSQSGYSTADRDPGPQPKDGGEPAWFNCSLGAKKAKIDKAQNWNPKMWGDRME